MRQSRPLVKTQALTTPRAAAIAGILFSILFTTALFLIRSSIPPDASESASWLTENRRILTLALALIPYADIAFLWFVGVVRSHLGNLEDQFFSTVFFGSGMLFLGLTLVAAALVGGMVSFYALHVDQAIETSLYTYVRLVINYLFNVFAIRMEGVFMISLGTIWVRTRVMPLWLAVLTYVTALILLISINLSLWVGLFFPGWVMVISLYILILNLRQPTPPQVAESSS